MKKSARDRFPGFGYRRFSLILALAFVTGPLAAQTATPPVAVTPPLASAASGVLPKGYDGILLGMTRDEVIEKLKANSQFAWRGPEDVSLLPSPNQSLIEVAGLGFVRRAFFQFNEGRLWVIILNLASDRIDHYSIYSKLVSSYGEPARLDPSASTWENAAIRISLERPLTLRYLDLGVFTKLKDAGAAKASVEELERRDFLGTL